MQSGLKSISKIFTESIFRIPDYQRGYSWSSKQLIDFWNDIEQLPNKNNHYTGVITLEAVKEDDYKKWSDDLWIIENKSFAPYYVVDGQQRLTTTIILIQSIIESTEQKELLNYTTKEEIIKKFIFESKDNGISRSFVFGYEDENPSYLYLKNEILTSDSTKSIKLDETLYTNNLKKAKIFFKEKIKSLTTEERAVIFTKISQHLLFNIFHIEQDLDVFVTF